VENGKLATDARHPCVNIPPSKSRFSEKIISLHPPPRHVSLAEDPFPRDSPHDTCYLPSTRCLTLHSWLLLICYQTRFQASVAFPLLSRRLCRTFSLRLSSIHGLSSRSVVAHSRSVGLSFLDEPRSAEVPFLILTFSSSRGSLLIFSESRQPFWCFSPSKPAPRIFPASSFPPSGLSLRAISYEPRASLVSNLCVETFGEKRYPNFDFVENACSASPNKQLRIHCVRDSESRRNRAA